MRQRCLISNVGGRETRAPAAASLATASTYSRAHAAHPQVAVRVRPRPLLGDRGGDDAHIARRGRRRPRLAHRPGRPVGGDGARRRARGAGGGRPAPRPPQPRLRPDRRAPGRPAPERARRRAGLAVRGDRRPAHAALARERALVEGPKPAGRRRGDRHRAGVHDWPRRGRDAPDAAPAAAGRPARLRARAPPPGSRRARARRVRARRDRLRLRARAQGHPPHAVRDREGAAQPELPRLEHRRRRAALLTTAAHAAQATTFTPEPKPVPSGSWIAMWRYPSASSSRARASGPVSTARMPPSSTSCLTVALAASSSPAMKTSSGWPATLPSTSVPAKVVLNALTTFAPSGAAPAISCAADPASSDSGWNVEKSTGFVMSTMTAPPRLSRCVARTSAAAV